MKLEKVQGSATPLSAGQRWLAALVAVAFVAGFSLLLTRLIDLRPRLTREDAAALITSTLQRESRQAFVVTGALDIVVTTRVENVRRLLPGLLDVNLGSVETTVRAPGRASYGFDVGALRAESIRVSGDTIEMRVPPVRVYSVEPALDRMDVRTTSGWLRVRESDTQGDVQQRATALVGTALRRQAEAHLKDSEQSRINTAETLSELLRPAFQAQGRRAPVFRFIIDERLVYTGEKRRR